MKNASTYILREWYTSFIIKLINTILGEHVNYYYKTCCKKNMLILIFIYWRVNSSLIAHEYLVFVYNVKQKMSILI